MRLATAMRTHVGGRSKNEDFADHALFDGVGCWVVADGLGGHGRGEIASSAAVRGVLDAFSADPTVSEQHAGTLVDKGHAAVRQAQEEADYYQALTTVTVVLSDGQTAAWAHVGDTRIYAVRDGGIIHQTTDHSVIQTLVEAGKVSPDEVRSHPERHRILRALGREEPPKVETFGPIPVQPDDAFLLCSDGWWEYVTEREMEFDYAKSATPDEWLDHMLDRVLTRGEDKFDNLTAIGVFLTPDESG